MLSVPKIQRNPQGALAYLITCTRYVGHKISIAARPVWSDLQRYTQVRHYYTSTHRRNMMVCCCNRHQTPLFVSGKAPNASFRFRFQKIANASFRFRFQKRSNAYFRFREKHQTSLSFLYYSEKRQTPLFVLGKTSNASVRLRKTFKRLLSFSFSEKPLDRRDGMDSSFVPTPITDRSNKTKQTQGKLNQVKSNQVKLKQTNQQKSHQIK